MVGDGLNEVSGLASCVEGARKGEGVNANLSSARFTYGVLGLNLFPFIWFYTNFEISIGY